MRIRLPKLPNSGVLLLFGAVVFAAVAVFLAHAYIDRTITKERERLAPTQDLVEIVVALDDLPPGAVVSTETMAIRKIPSEYISRATVTPDTFDMVVGSSLKIPMRKGEPLLQSSVVGADKSTFSGKIKAGWRAITFPVDEVNSIAGLLQPGDRVDLLLTVKSAEASSGGTPQHEQTICLLQDVAVLATGQDLRPASLEDSKGRDGGRFSTATVELSPSDASKMIVAQQAGKISATLRGPDDRARLPCVPRDISSLIPPSGGRARPHRGLEIIVGGRGELSRSTITLPTGMPELRADVGEPVPANPPVARAPNNSLTN